MVKKIEAPATDAYIDFGDLPGSATSIILAVIGMALFFGVFKSGQTVWNRISQETSAVSEAEWVF